jgi:hypothetical protein
MATTRQLPDYLNSLTQKDRLSATDKINIIDVDGGNVLKSVSISNISASLVVTGSITATSFIGDGSGLTGISGGGGGTSLPYLQLTNSAIVYNPYIGEVVSFIKSDYGDEVDEIDENFSITRGVQRGIYNPILEEGWDTDFPYTSPSGSLWNADGWGDLKDTTQRSYTTFYEALGGNIGENVVGTELILHDTINDKYYAVKFSSWTQNAEGGGFSYTRQQINTSNYFFKPDNDTDTIDVFLEDDGEGSGIGITRGANNGIYNPYREDGWDSDVSPSGTLWNVDGWGDFSDLTDRTYQSFYAAFGYGGLGNKVVGTECVMYIPETDEYYAIQFQSWTQSGGGGFSYVRYPIDLTQLNEGVKFSDGTVLKSAKGLGNVKATFEGNRRIEESVGYVSVSVTEAIVGDSVEATVYQNNNGGFDFYVVDTQELIELSESSYTKLEFSFDGGNTWKELILSGGNGVSRQIYFADDSQGYETVTQGQTLFYRVTTGGEPVRWFNASGANFRGAIIEYHAYSTDSGTIIGTIWIADDSGDDIISHIETTSGGDNLSNVELWYRPSNADEREIWFRRLDGEADTLKIQWIAKMFYGSEYYD